MKKHPVRILSRLSCIALLLLAALIVMTLGGCKRTEIIRQEFSQLGSISELATLKCFYHNVAEYESGAKSFLRLNYKKVWIKYSGTVRVGIDASKVSAQIQEDGDTVVVTIPKAQVLDIDFDENSIQKLSETGSVFSSVSSQTDLEIFTKAQEDMELTAREDQNMLLQAQSRAKRVIGQYIQECGKAVGKTYSIEWKEVEDEPKPVEQECASGQSETDA